MAEMLIKLEADATGWYDNLRCTAPCLRDGWAIVPAELGEIVAQNGGVVKLTVGQAPAEDWPEIQDRRTDRSVPYPVVTAVEAGTYVPPPGPTEEELAAARERRQEENKAALARWLGEHPLTWADGNVYGVTEADQNEMALNLQQYQIQKAAGREVKLEWHTQKKQCHTFTEEQYSALLLAVIEYVYPYRRYQEAVKEQIYSAQTMADVAAVVIEYGAVSHA